MRRVRNGCTMEDSTPFCTLCGISLPLSSKRRTMSTSDEAPSSFDKCALLLTRELRVIITLTVLLLVISHARQYVTGSSGMSYCNQTPFPPREGWGLGTRLAYHTKWVSCRLTGADPEIEEGGITHRVVLKRPYGARIALLWGQGLK